MTHDEANFLVHAPPGEQLTLGVTVDETGTIALLIQKGIAVDQIALPVSTAARLAADLHEAATLVGEVYAPAKQRRKPRYEN